MIKFYLACLSECIDMMLVNRWLGYKTVWRYLSQWVVRDVGVLRVNALYPFLGRDFRKPRPQATRVGVVSTQGLDAPCFFSPVPQGVKQHLSF